jgi:nucleoside-diphosphate-sugar epimerase
MSDNELHVIFGTGPVGMAIMEKLVANGKRVRMINRSGKGDFPDGVDLLSGDAMNHDFTRQAVEGAIVVYNALNPPYDQWLRFFSPLQKSVLEAATSVGAKLIVMENLYMYGHTHGKPMTEATPYDAHTRKGKLRADMANELLEAHRAGKVRIAMGRASDFFGPRGLQSGMGERVIYPALEGKAAQILGNPDLAHTYTYLPDIGKALVILGEREETLGQAWHIPAEKTLTTREFIDMIYQEAGHPPKISVAPKLIMKALGLFNPIIREVNEMAYEFDEPFISDHSKFTQAFGDHPTPLADAIRTTVSWFKDHPKQ